MKLEELLPEYPRIRHLPFRPNATRDDLIASQNEVQIIFESDEVYIEEKIDASNCGIVFFEGHPVIRNRNHILLKGRPKAKTSAGTQFNYIYNWFYENISKFEALEVLCEFPPTLYGEWMFATHSVYYTALPDYFVAFDLYSPISKYFLNTGETRMLLEEAGFATTPLLHKGKLDNWEQLEAFCQQKSEFADSKREGIVVKTCNKERLLDRFKMVRHDFIQGEHWSDKTITRNKLR